MNDSALRGLRRFAPGVAALLRYERKDLRFDVGAGLSVAAVALPVGIAYAELANVPTVVGIYSAIFPLLAYALFGSSRQLITGPDAAVCTMAAASIGAIAGGDPERYGALMVALALSTGLVHIVAGIARFGFISSFLSQPILVGYLNGIALVIIVGQLPTLFGLPGHREDFASQVASFVGEVGAFHPLTLALGASLVAILVALKRFAPRLPGPLLVAGLGIVAVAVWRLNERGVSVLGAVPGGLPTFRMPALGASDLGGLAGDALGLTLISFTSGILTSKSFARRGGYAIDANQELIGIGAANLASGLAQGFPVTGAGSRTAVNAGVGGRTQLVGIVAAMTMLGFLLFLTDLLALLPKTALAAIIIVSALGFFDRVAVRNLSLASRRELTFSAVTTVGVLAFGVLPGVVVAIAVSILWLLSVGSRPHDAVLGRVPDLPGLHDVEGSPSASTTPGLLIYRFDSGLVFFNCEHFAERVLHFVDASPSPVEWVLVDAGPINIVDYTAMLQVEGLRDELAARGIVLAFARVKRTLSRFFRAPWYAHVGKGGVRIYTGLEEAIRAFEDRASEPARPPEPSAA